MVFFCCDNCGESLKKNQVEKHNYKCRSQSYSCLDCQMRFTSTSYAQHLKCITENQKYGGKGYVEKEAKGEVKQNAWCEQVQQAIENVSEPALKRLLSDIQGYGNIPRKEAKFVNFLTNSCNIRDTGLCQRAWKAIAAETEKQKKIEEEAKKKEQEAKQAAEAAKKAKDEESAATTTSGNAAEASGDSANFKWKATIKRKLKAAGGEMKVKKLRKEVVEAYMEAIGEEDSEAASELFDDKLKKAGVAVNGKSVSLAA